MKIQLSITLVILLVIGVPLLLIYIFMFAPKSKIIDDSQYWFLVLDEKYYKSSQKPGWHTIDFGTFNIEMPQGYFYFRIKSVDSFVGEIATKDRSKVYSFDYGLYSNRLDTYFSKYDYDVSVDTLNGKYARLVLPNNETVSNSGIHIKKIENDNSLTIFGNGLNREESIYAFKSIDFNHKGFTSLNFGKNITTLSDEPEIIFKKNCAQCHGYYEKVISKYPLSEMSKLDTLFLKEFIYSSKELDYEFLDINFEHDYSYFKEVELDGLVKFIKTFDTGKSYDPL